MPARFRTTFSRSIPSKLGVFFRPAMLVGLPECVRPPLQKKPSQTIGQERYTPKNSHAT